MPRLKAGLLALLTAAALTPMENGEAIVRPLHQAPETLPYLWGAGTRSARWKNIAKALIKVYEALLTLERAMQGGPVPVPLAAPPGVPLPLAVIQPAPLVAGAAPPQAGGGAQAATAPTTTPSTPTYQVLWDVTLSAILDCVWFRRLAWVYRWALFFACKLVPQVVIGGGMIFGICIICALVAQPMLLLRLMFWCIRLVPNYLAYMSETFGNELWSQVTTSQWRSHCEYDSVWADMTSGAQPPPKPAPQAWFPAQPAPAPPPICCALLPTAFVAYVLARLH